MFASHSRMHVRRLTFTDILTRHTVAQPLHCHLNYWFTIEGGIRAPTRESGAAIATKRAETRMVAEWRGDGRQGRESKIVFTGCFRLPPGLRHFPPFSPAWPVKCAAIGFRPPLFTEGCPYHPPSRNPVTRRTPHDPANPVYIDFLPVWFHLPSLIIASWQQVSSYHRYTDILVTLAVVDLTKYWKILA